MEATTLPLSGKNTVALEDNHLSLSQWLWKEQLGKTYLSPNTKALTVSCPGSVELRGSVASLLYHVHPSKKDCFN